MTNNKQQTAVEWLFSYMFNPSLPQKEQFELLEQAKEMEKERMIQFTNEWFEEYQCGLGNFKNPEQYYNETYGGNK